MVKLIRFDASGIAAMRVVIPAVVMCAALLAGAALFVPDAASHWFLSEHGPLEIAAIWLWLGLAAFLFAVMRPITPAVVAGAYICVCCAMREADWHKHFTGYSVMKVHFYYMPEHPLSHRIIAAAVVIPLIASLVILGYALMKRALSESHRAIPAWLALVAVGGAIVIGTKLLDRIPDLLNEWTGMRLPEWSALVFRAWEEGFEALMPVLFGAAALLLSLQERRLRVEHTRVIPAIPVTGAAS